MRNTRKSKDKMKKNKSIKNSFLKDASFFEKEVTKIFLEMLIMIKLFHWNTHSYAQHKATDKLYSSFNDHMDKFIEVLLGKVGNRVPFSTSQSIKMYDFKSKEKLIKKINWFKGYLVEMHSHTFFNKFPKMKNFDLLNIRDEILADMNQFLYLLSLN